MFASVASAGADGSQVLFLPLVTNVVGFPFVVTDRRVCVKIQK